MSPLIINLSHALMFGHVGESLDVGAVAQTFEGVCQYDIRRILVPLALLLEAARWSILDDFLNGCRTKTMLKVPLSCNQDLWTQIYFYDIYECSCPVSLTFVCIICIERERETDSCT